MKTSDQRAELASLLKNARDGIAFSNDIVEQVLVSHLELLDKFERVTTCR